MITISGVYVDREHGTPTLYDIGYSLRQLPRFVGYVKRSWSVLGHVMACARYAAAKKHDIRTQLYCLLHDADECCTGDIPPIWKTEELKTWQREIRTRIYMSLGIGQPSLQTDRIVHQIDSQMLYAEARIFAPQVMKSLITPGPDFREGIDTQDTLANYAVIEVDDWLSYLGPREAAIDFEAFVDYLKGQL